MKLVAEDPKLLNARGPEGSTPFMYAVLYSDPATLGQLLAKGADPNKRNDANATALMWAATDLDKTLLLLMHGADINARSDDARTPLMIAAGRPGNAPVVKLLLERGANPNPSTNPAAESSPLIEAAMAGDAESMQLLMDRGADIKSAGAPAFALAVATKCSICIELVSKNLDAAASTIELASSTAALGDVNAVRLMLDHGANVNTAGPFGRTPLMYAAVSYLLPLEEVKLLIERGADVNAKSASGQTALDIAKLRGHTPSVDLLVRSGARGAAAISPVLKLQRGNTIQGAVQRSLPLLQRTDLRFVQKAGCVSCHNESLTAMTVSRARRHGFPVDEPMAAQQVQANVSAIHDQLERIRQGISVPLVGPGILSYILIGLDAEGYRPDINTDAVAMYVRARQMPDGRWTAGAASDRPPLCWNDIGQTALALRAIQRYAPNVDKASDAKSVELAAQWLAKTEPKTNDDRSWRLLGLAWAGKDKRAIQNGLRELLAAQRSDGGWSDIPSIGSTAYATGLALVALNTAGFSVSESAYQRGVQFLLSTQLEDGSWYVKTRALGFQPYFETGFPHGPDQWISAAATNWATMALTLASGTRPVNSTARAGF